MSKPLNFATGDITRLVKALRKAGETPTSVEIDPSGKIVAKFGPPENDDPASGVNPWDEVLTNGQEERPAVKRH